MSYQVISRKYRPQRFDEIVGQEHITTTLQNAIQAHRISHAYLFTGSRGIGKTTTARILAKTLNCLEPKQANPCNTCRNCKEITTGRSVNVLEIDGASNRGINEIRDLRENVKYPPSQANYRIFIIDEVHMLTKEAFNALLKTLEEPPPHVIFIFATTEPSKVPETIISRCQRYDFHRIPVEKIVPQLEYIAQEEKVEILRDILILIAKKVEGGMRDAESLLDQVISFSGKKVKIEDAQRILGLIDYNYFMELSKLVLQQDRAALVKRAHEVFNKGVEVGEFLAGLGEHFRNLLIAKTTGSVEMIDLPAEMKSKYIAEADQWNSGDLLRLIQLTTDAKVNLKSALNQRTHLELLLLKMGSLDKTITIQQLIQAIESGGTSRKNTTLTSKPVSSSGMHSVKEGKPHSKTGQVSKEAGEQQTDSQHDDAGDLKKIKQHWEKIIEEVRQTNVSLATFLKHGEPHQIKHNTLAITFHKSADFQRQNVKNKANVIEKAIRKLIGRSLRIKCILSNQNSKIIPDTKEVDEMAEKLAKDFDGEIIV